MANESINLNLIPKGDMPVIHVSQFDNGRQFTINLLKGSDEYSMPEGYTATLNCRKSDRNIVTLATTSVLSNVLTFTTTTQLCACAGKNLCEVVIKDAEDYQVGTSNFILEVEKDPLQGGIESTSEIHDLTNQIEEITTEIVGENYYTKTETDTMLDAKANTSDLAVVATSGSYLDLDYKPSINGARISGNRTGQYYGLADLSAVYTKSQVDTALSAKANTADLATVATTGSYTDLTNKPDIPAAQVQSDYAQVDNTKVDYIKNKPDLSIYAKESDLILATGTENEAPYQIRHAPSNIGNLAMEKIVGVSCVFNQNLQPPTFTKSFSDYSVVGNGDGSATLTIINPIDSDYANLFNTSYQFITGHKYYVYTGNDNIRLYFKSEDKKTAIFNSTNGSSYNNIALSFNSSLTAGEYTIYLMLIDLTAMFGSEVADYIYALESGTAGAGLSLFKSLFAKDYYPYTANTLMSAKPTSKVIKDSSDQTVATIVYSGNELRGLLKVGTDGLYADGDIDDGSGSTAVRYEQRAYQSGDESLPDAITDGTNTVVKLATPTTASSTAWTNPIAASAGGTEEFTDTRTIKMFTGHDTIYSKKTDYRYLG